MLETIDTVRINFNANSLLILNFALAFIMFGIALQLKFDSFKLILRRPKAAFVGIVSQFLLLPIISYLLVLILEPAPSMALGMLLVASCPGGNISNFLSSLSKSNVALSISLTTFSSVFAFILTPLNFLFWANLYAPTASLLKDIHIDAVQMLLTVFFILGLPLLAGIYVARKYPVFTKKIIKPMTIVSLLIFVSFVVIAFSNNLKIFLDTMEYFAFIVFLHNALALLSGYSFARLFRLNEVDSRTVSIETGIQNSGLALALVFTFFQGLGGMALIAAFWGIWHLISGLTLAMYWAKNPAADTEENLSRANG